MIVSVIANVKRDPDKHKDPYEPSDFFPLLREDEPTKEPMTGEQMNDQLIFITKALGGEVKTDK